MNDGERTPTVEGPQVRLPQRVPTQHARGVQSNIPARLADRERVMRAAKGWVRLRQLVAPMAMGELREHAVDLLVELQLPVAFEDYAAVILNNAAQRDELARIPFHRRLLLLPKCLRIAERCPAPFDALGLLCKDCGLCSLQDLTAEAERLGYAVLIAEGSAVVRRLVEEGKVDAVIGVACLHVLERSFPHLVTGAVPGLAIPLLQDDCHDTTVDMHHVWDVIHLTCDDSSYRLDLDALREEVRADFAPESLVELMGPTRGPADGLARAALVGGKRWRPFLTVCAWLAVRADAGVQGLEISDEVRKLAVALECFHKASLVHDDIEDGDEVRDQQPSLFARHGVAQALNAGDLLLGEGYRLLAELQAPGERVAAIVGEAARGHLALSRGQGQELADRGRETPPPTLEVLDVFRLKTAPAFEVALVCGARLAGASEAVLAVLRSYSEAVGIAYQLHDDLDDLTQPGVDVRGSVLLAIAYKRSADAEDRAMLAAAWRGEVGMSEELVALLVRTSAVKKTGELAKAWEEQAVRALRALDQPTLKGLLRRVVAKLFPQELVEGMCDERAARHVADGPARA